MGRFPVNAFASVSPFGQWVLPFGFWLSHLAFICKVYLPDHRGEVAEQLGGYSEGCTPKICKRSYGLVSFFFVFFETVHTIDKTKNKKKL